MTLIRTILLFPALALVCLAAACSSGGSATPEEPATITTTSIASTTTETAASSTAAANSDVPTKSGPQTGVACPVAPVLCQFAIDMETILKAGDLDAFFAAANPVPATCTGEQGLGGPSPALCDGAAANEVRMGYWALQGGEGLIVTEAELRTAMARWLDSMARAGGTSDTYGPGELRIGSISCTRQPDRPTGNCIGNSIQVHFTFINPETVNGTGLPGQRITFHVSAGVVDGVPRPNGFGTVAPPNRPLSAGVVNITDGAGNPLLLEIYPWTH